jgi:hypothetical protein
VPRSDLVQLVLCNWAEAAFDGIGGRTLNLSTSRGCSPPVKRPLERPPRARPSEGTTVRFLDNDIVEFAGVRFLGTTLWTDYRLEPNLTQGQAMRMAERAINDHRLIRCDGGFFTAQRALSEHERSRAWLAEELGRPYDGRTVVVTHHGPHANSVHPRFKGSPVNPAFNSDLSELLPKAHVWLHGHVHDSFDYCVEGCRVVANPLGYPTNAGSARNPQDLVFENKAFQWACVLDIS